METKYINFNGLELPPYLAYDILNEKSIKYENDELYAEYVFECDGSLVHKVRIKKDRAHLDTFCQGKTGFISSYPTLKQTLMYECMSWQLHKDAPFQFLSKEICSLGNIYVNHSKPDKKSTSVNFFPAAKMFLFSLPLATKSEKYLNFLELIKGSNLIKFYRERNGHILFIKPNSEIRILNITIADFIVPLAHLYNAAKIFAIENIIEKSKLFRLIINESYDADSSLMQSFIGDEQNKYFSIIYKEFPKEKYSALAEMFLLQVEGLRGLQKQ